jgi:hypothetical protein
MTASRIIIQGKLVLKLNIHEYDESDIAFLDQLGISETESDHAAFRYTHIHSKEDFLSIRSALFERYDVIEEGPKAHLKAR